MVQLDLVLLVFDHEPITRDEWILDIIKRLRARSDSIVPRPNFGVIPSFPCRTLEFETTRLSLEDILQ